MRLRTEASVVVVTIELKSFRTKAFIAAVCVDTSLRAAAVLHQTFIHILTPNTHTYSGIEGVIAAPKVVRCMMPHYNPIITPIFAVNTA